ncbi:hypothetical protein DPMN_138638 [Dreissena polymorpha]|uniref:Uncharacterized protein n=1 Tax=Dreissena polymorpha TaxID=45954 RepID=A0A9D4G4B1_DREPO|nr:hypothetical protein DPMN_138638 [Dreissena polymorpha]
MIALISTALTKRGCYVLVSPGDADVDLLKQQWNDPANSPTTLIGEDTDCVSGDIGQLNVIYWIL